VSPPPVPLPPGRTERVRAASALVLAPHFDDEVLGCGGLLAQLAAAGATVRVLFLTDGGGGREAVADRDGYRLRRRQEALAAAAVLGIAGCDFLDLPDGGLAQHLAQAVDGVRGALLGQRPELLLCPSPLEVTADHRAAFAAAHFVLGSRRLRAGGTAAGGAADGAAAGAGGKAGMASAEAAPPAGLRILLYEVNQPAYPNLLVDVSAAEDLLRRAMGCYASQEERHPYLDAALGLRRFRTLSLAPDAGLAEGYRQLALEDFTSRSLAQLVRHLGGEPELLEVREGPAISVVVRTRDRPELLAEALGSLAAGEYRRVTVVLVNDGGAPPPVPAGFAATAAAAAGGTAGAAARHAPRGAAAGALPLLRIDLPVPRGRAAAAAAGIAAATGDYVAFLDDDDLAAPEHLATLAGMVSAAAVRIAYTDAAVGVYELAGDAGWSCRERRLPYSRDFDPDMLLVDNYIPFNTVLIERRLLDEVGPPDETLPFFEDWDLLIRLAALAPFHHLARVTCEYRHFRGPMSHVFGERPRERADFLLVKARVLAKHAARLTPAALARAVDTLRGELVAEREAAAAGERRLEAVRQEHAEIIRVNRGLSAERFHFEDRFHAVHGELQALRDDHQRVREEARRLGEEMASREAAAARLSSELQRVYGEESRLHAAADEQAAHLGRTYAEIERLNRLVREMEASRAWRLHQWLQRRRS